MEDCGPRDSDLVDATDTSYAETEGAPKSPQDCADVVGELAGPLDFGEQAELRFDLFRRALGGMLGDAGIIPLPRPPMD